MSDSQDFQYKIPKIFNGRPVPKAAPKSQRDRAGARDTPNRGRRGLGNPKEGGTKDFLFPLHSNLRHYSLLSKMVMVISFTS